MSAERNPRFAHLGEFNDPPTSLALRGHLGRLLAHGEHLVAQAEKESRGLTEREQKRFTEITEEAALAKAEIAVAKAEEEARVAPILAKLNEPVIVAGPGPTMKAFENTARGREAAYLAGQFVKGVLLGDVKAQDWLRGHLPDVDRTIRAAHSEGVNSAGGVLVPQELSRSIIRLVETYGVARRVSRVINTSSDSISIPRRTGGLTASFTAENAAIAESDTSWSSVELNPKKIAVLTRVSSELSDDAVVSVIDMLAEEVALSFAQAEDQCLLIGTGTSTYGGMTGAFVKAINGSYPLATVAAASGHDLFGELDLDDLISLMALVPLYARPTAVWLCSPQAKVAVFDSLRAAAGGLSSADLANGVDARFLGSPIIESPVLPGSLTTDYTALAMLGYGSLSLASTMAVRSEIRMQVSRDRFFEFDQVGVRATERFDAVVHDLGSSTVASPFAVLTGGAG